MLPLLTPSMYTKGEQIARIVTANTSMTGRLQRPKDERLGAGAGVFVFSLIKTDIPYALNAPEVMPCMKGRVA